MTPSSTVRKAFNATTGPERTLQYGMRQFQVTTWDWCALY